MKQPIFIDTYRIPLRGLGSTRIAGSVETEAESTKLAALCSSVKDNTWTKNEIHKQTYALTNT